MSYLQLINYKYTCYIKINDYLNNMNIKNLIMWVIIVLLSVGLFNMFQDPKRLILKEIHFHFQIFLNEVDAGRVVEVQIQGNNISGVLADGKTFKTYSPNYPELVDKLSSKGVSIVAHPKKIKCHHF